MGDHGAALKVGDRVTLGSEYLDSPMSTHSLQKAKTERTEFVRGHCYLSGQQLWYVAVVESSTVVNSPRQQEDPLW